MINYAEYWLKRQLTPPDCKQLPLKPLEQAVLAKISYKRHVKDYKKL